MKGLRPAHVGPAALAVAALGGCRLDADIALEGDRARPRMIVTMAGGDSACVQGLTVTEVSGNERRDAWAVRRVDASTDDSCQSVFDYGVAPPGYEIAVPLTPIFSNRRYEVSATGSGWHAKALLPPSA